MDRAKTASFYDWQLDNGCVDKFWFAAKGRANSTTAKLNRKTMRTDILQRLRIDPGQRTLGQLL